MANYIPTLPCNSVTSRPLLDGSLGTISAVHHLTPFRAPVPSHPAPEPGQGTAQLQQQQQPQAAALTLAPTATAIVGDGMVAVCSSTGVHVALVRPWGDLVQLFSRGSSWAPEEEGDGASAAGAARTRPGVLPTAAWMPHAPLRGGGGPGDDILVPVATEAPPTCPIAVLAVGWDRRVVFYDVPLIGDLPIASGGDSSGECGRWYVSVDGGMKIVGFGSLYVHR